MSQRAPSIRWPPRRSRNSSESWSKRYTIVIVTHSMQQAARVSDKTVFFYVRRKNSWSTTTRTFIFTKPSDSRTEDYITGRFG